MVVLQPGLCRTWSEPPGDVFFRDAAHFKVKAERGEEQSVKTSLNDAMIGNIFCKSMKLPPAYEGGSIYNGNTLITQPTGALEFYTSYGTNDQGFTFSMMHRILFYLYYLFSYRLLKKVYIYTLCINSS